MVESLVEDIARRDNHLSTGIIGCRVLLDVLTQHNRTEAAYALAMQDTYPSWGHFVRQNATTLWERWEASTYDPTGGSSMNHVMYGGQQGWYYTALGGLTLAPGPAGVNYKEVRIAPKVPAQLGHVALRLSTPRGDLHVQWSQRVDAAQGARFTLSTTIPVGTNASICIPVFGSLAGGARVTEGAKPVWAAGNFVPGTEGVRTGKFDVSLDAVCLVTGSGNYSFALWHEDAGKTFV